MTSSATSRHLLQVQCKRMRHNENNNYLHVHPAHVGKLDLFQDAPDQYRMTWSSWQPSTHDLQLLLPLQSATFGKYQGPSEHDDHRIYVLQLKDGSHASYHFELGEWNTSQHEQQAATIDSFLQTPCGERVDQVVYNQVQDINGVSTVHVQCLPAFAASTLGLLSLTRWDLVDLTPLHRYFPASLGIVEHIASYLPVTVKELISSTSNGWHNAGEQLHLVTINVPAHTRLTSLELCNGHYKLRGEPWTLRIQVVQHSGRVVYEVYSQVLKEASKQYGDVSCIDLTPLNLYLRPRSTVSNSHDEQTDPTNQYRVVVTALFDARTGITAMDLRLSYCRPYETPLPKRLIESATKHHRDHHTKSMVELRDDKQCQRGYWAHHDHRHSGYALSLPPEYIGWRTLANHYTNPLMNPPPNAHMPIPSPLPRRFRIFRHKDGTTSTSDSHLYIPQYDEHVLAETPQLFATQLVIDDIALRAGEQFSWCALGAPRMQSYADKRSHLARDVAEILYPANTQSDVIESRIKYQHLIARLSLTLRQHVLDGNTLSRKDRHVVRTQQEQQQSTGKLLSLNDEEYAQRLAEAVSPAVVAPLPMPVTPSTEETLAPFFEYLSRNEPLPNIGKVEYERGIVYQDGRMDLCKQVVGPGLIQPLLDALTANQRVKHFLLGNNIIGVTGSKAIAAFIMAKLQRIETWYLAGNCIDEQGIQNIAEALTADTYCKYLWLKRNPILPGGALHLAHLLARSRSIRVLDLDNCGLQDDGVELLCRGLRGNKDTLQHLYLDGNGITSAGCTYIAEYFHFCHANELHGLESLFMSINLIGDEGATILSQALKHNRHLKRLNLSSNGIQAQGLVALFESLLHHPTIMSFEVGYASQSVDLGGVPNRGTDQCVDSIVAFVHSSKSLRVLNANSNRFTAYGVRAIMNSCIASASLLHVNLMEAGIEWPQQLEQALHQHLSHNIKIVYGEGVDRDGFLREQLWKVRNIQETAHIESLYRTRGFRDRASRRQMVKYWNEHDIMLLDSEEYGSTYQVVKAAKAKQMSQLQIAYVTK